MNKKITILFDANPLAAPNKAGVGYYTERLVTALAAAYPDRLELVGHYFNFLGRKRPDLPKAPNIRYRSSKLLPGKVLSFVRRFGWQLPLEVLFKQRGDVALFTNFVSLPSLSHIKKVVAVHDLSFVDFPDFLQPANRRFLSRFVPRSLGKADLVLTISDSTKRSIISHYHVSNKKILVTHIPPPTHESASAQPIDLAWSGKYILFVSTLEPRKNFINLARAYSLLPRDLKEKYALVLAGGAGWRVDNELEEIKKLQQAGNNILLTGYISEDQKSRLYAQASLFVMPSVYEGFGMPLLEAMSYNLPVAVSDIAVFHEVAGKTAVYFDQSDPVAIAKTVEATLRDESLRKNLAAAGRARLKNFSWEKVAADVYERINQMVG